MEKGQLIEFRHQGERRLAVVDRPDGKKDWVVIDQQGQSHKLKPQRVEYEIPGGPYTVDDLPSFLGKWTSISTPLVWRWPGNY